MKGVLMLLITVLCCNFSNCNIDYVDCGSTFYIRKVHVQNCDYSNCTFQLGEKIYANITLHPRESINSLDTKVYISQYGQKWQATVSPADPCSQWECPISTTSVLSYFCEIQLETIYLKRTADVYLESYLGEVMVICIMFKIELI